MRADVSNTAELLSKEFENWDLRRSALPLLTDVAWINDGPLSSSWDDARPPELRPDPAHRDAQVRDGRRLRELPLTAAGSRPRGTPRTPMPSGPPPRPGTSTRPRRRIHAAATAGEHPGNGPRQPRGLGRPLAGQPRGNRCRRAELHASPRGTCSTSRTGRWTGASPGRRSRTAPAR